MSPYAHSLGLTNEGKCWKVQIRKQGDIFYPTDGWKNLVDDLDLHIASILIFNFIDNSTLNMMYFDAGKKKMSTARVVNAMRKKRRCHQSRFFAIVKSFMIVHVEEINGRIANFVEIPAYLSERMQFALKSSGVSKLYMYVVAFMFAVYGSNPSFVFCTALSEYLSTTKISLSWINMVTLFHSEDKPRIGAEDVILELKEQAKLHEMMLTGGEHEFNGIKVANAVGIDEIHCSLKLGDKLNHISNIPRDTSHNSILLLPQSTSRSSTNAQLARTKEHTPKCIGSLVIQNRKNV
ncbi:hypothetical protein L1987_52909 [Smallanthus sonchifolius]|uniref:Uncharacterized protein n=1 Tax=Smallanthus sonchifolius TaxID=185202 RepID=A0ACB9EU51_9ASTR|nr:hypothetical protein L1987_52909 [Smallanthus sonchifolius]